jgi:hypothetical protein
MQRCSGLVVLTALVGTVTIASSARAQDPAEVIKAYPALQTSPEVMKTYTGPPNLYAPTEPEVDLVEVLGLRPTGPDLKRFHLVSNAVKQHPCYCVAHHNSVGCGSFKAECAYIFGGCRLFYGEPCYKGPDPYPHKSLFHKGEGCKSCGP